MEWHSLVWLDWLALGVLGASLLIGIMRGVVKELFSLVGWVAAFWLAGAFSVSLAHALFSFVGNETVRLMVAFAGIFAGTWILVALLGMLLNSFVNSVGLGFLNRMLGGLFGLLRGALILAVLALLAGMTALPAQREWKTANFSAWAERGGEMLVPYLPRGMAERIHF